MKAMFKINKGIIYALIAVLIYSTIGLFTKLAVSSMDGFVVAVYLQLIASLLFLVIVAAKKELGALWKLFAKNWLILAIAGAIGFGLQQFTLLKAYQLALASTVVPVFYLFPLFIVLLSGIIYKQKIGIMNFVFVLLGFSGVFLFISKGALSLDINSGIIFALTASLCWGSFSVFIKNRKFDIYQSMFWYNFFGLLFLLVYIPFVKADFFPALDFGQLLGFIYLAVFPNGIVLIFWNLALRNMKVELMSNMALLIPIISIFLISIFLKESISLVQMIAFTIVLVSLFLNLNYKSERKLKKQNR